MRLAFVDGTKGFSPSRLGDQPAGGIVTSLTILPRLLSAKGHDVWVQSGHPVEEEVAGVRYLPATSPLPRVDAIIFNRNMLNRELLRIAREKSDRVIWWLHDIVDHRYMVDGAFKEVDGIVSLSDYCTDTYSRYYGLARDLFFQIPNGVDKKVWHPGPAGDRDPGLFVFASAPIKGVAPLGFTFEQLKRNIPGARLQVFGGQKVHDLEEFSWHGRWIDTMKKEGADIHGAVPQTELASVFRRASVLLMPNNYPEICSNLILQAGACGLPVVTSPIGSAPQFVHPHINGALTETYPHDKFLWWADFARETVDLALDRERNQKLSSTAPLAIKGWDQIAKAWEEYVEKLLSAENSKLQRLQ